MTEKNDYKSGFASMIGRPNVGKSTLMNRIIGQKIAITSDKPQTTRNRIRTIYTTDSEQIVFLDTPGIHKAKNKLGDYMVSAAESALNDSDVILFVVEPTDYIGKGEQHIISLLKKSDTPILLVINKIDSVPREKLMEAISLYSSQMEFDEVVPVSAMKDDNIDELLKCIVKYLPYGERYYDEDTVTDQPIRQITSELIREKALRCLKDEIPHGIAVTVEKMEERKGLWDIEAQIICERESHKGIIIGKQGSMLKKIGSASRYEIERLLESKVNLQLWVKVRKDWRDSDILMKNYGYDIKEEFGD
ncbi:MAG: GTPase Era [Lachnospiraceae bacterium]|nr:GTPase Era [Lachnospiraceae bacterium]